MRLAVVAALLVTVACKQTAAPPPAAPADAADAVPHYQGLGDHVRKVTTQNEEAQKYFDQGLNFLYAFNHDEAIRSFRRATQLDPSCAMAHWASGRSISASICSFCSPNERPGIRLGWSGYCRSSRGSPRRIPSRRSSPASFRRVIPMNCPERGAAITAAGRR